MTYTYACMNYIYIVYLIIFHSIRTVIVYSSIASDRTVMRVRLDAGSAKRSVCMCACMYDFEWPVHCACVKSIIIIIIIIIMYM